MLTLGRRRAIHEARKVGRSLAERRQVPAKRGDGRRRERAAAAQEASRKAIEALKAEGAETERLTDAVARLHQTIRARPPANDVAFTPVSAGAARNNTDRLRAERESLDALERYRPGDTVTLDVLRGTERRQVAVTLDSSS